MMEEWRSELLVVSLLSFRAKISSSEELVVRTHQLNQESYKNKLTASRFPL